MKSRLVAWIVVSILGPGATLADSPIPPAAHKQVLGDHVFVMLLGNTQFRTRQWVVTETLPSESGQLYEVSGLYRSDGSVAPPWTLAGLTPLMAQIAPVAPPASNVGEPFSLAVGERMAIPDADIFVELERLSYRRCPAGAVCVAPDGPVVEYRVVEISTGTEVHRGASRRTPPDRFPHFVRQMDSDGDTYARFSVHDSVEWCESRASSVYRRCHGAH
jgi:hypothetical protein